MRCSNCGKELTPQDKFCSQCGWAVPPQDIFCSQCGKKLTAEDKFCSQCGKPVSSQAESARPAGTATVGVSPQTADKLSTERQKRLELLAGNMRTIAASENYAAQPSVAANPDKRAGAERTLASAIAVQMVCLTSMKRNDLGIWHTPDPVTTAEKRAYLVEALAIMDRAFASETLSKGGKEYKDILEKKGALQDAIRKIDEGKDSRVITCPHCQKWTDTRVAYCVHCNKSVSATASRPTVQTVTPPKPVPTARTATLPKPAPVARTVTQSKPAPQASTAQVRYADESMKKWTMLPGEKSVRGRHVVGLLQPEGGKFTYSMEVTNQRLLLWRESNKSSNFGYVARMGGGLLGSLIAEGAKAAMGAGPKPWLEIPLAAVSSCGLRNKGEFYITADQTYVLQNLGKYEKYLPDLVANAKK